MISPERVRLALGRPVFGSHAGPVVRVTKLLLFVCTQFARS